MALGTGSIAQAVPMAEQRQCTLEPFLPHHLLSDLRSQLLASMSLAGNTQFQGLQQAQRFFRGRLTSKQRKDLANLDVVVAWCRHASSFRVAQFYTDIVGTLHKSIAGDSGPGSCYGSCASSTADNIAGNVVLPHGREGS